MAEERDGITVEDFIYLMEENRKQLHPMIKSAVLEGLRNHEAVCPVLKEYPNLMRRFGRLEAKPPSTPGKSISISPEGIRIPWKSVPFRWIVAGITALLVALGIGSAAYSVSVDAVADVHPVDTDSPAVTVRK